MNKSVVALIVAVMFMAAAAVVYADEFLDRIHHQQSRIDNGIASGALSRQEADVVQDNLNWIKSTYSSMKSDGRLNQKEAQKLERMLDRNSKMIENRKQNPVNRVY